MEWLEHYSAGFMGAASEYVEITKEEFERFLESICDAAEYDADHYLFDFIQEAPSKWKRVEGVIKEYCYYIVVDLKRAYCLKVYSSINRVDDLGRGVGEDAIRVVVADANTGEPIRRALPIVKRIRRWKTNLRRRLTEAIASLGIDVMCPQPKCGHRLLLKKSKDGHVFLGCPKYPECKGSRNLGN